MVLQFAPGSVALRPQTRTKPECLLLMLIPGLPPQEVLIQEVGWAWEVTFMSTLGGSDAADQALGSTA